MYRHWKLPQSPHPPPPAVVHSAVRSVSKALSAPAAFAQTMPCRRTAQPSAPSPRQPSDASGAETAPAGSGPGHAMSPQRQDVWVDTLRRVVRIMLRSPPPPISTGGTRSLAGVSAPWALPRPPVRVPAAIRAVKSSEPPEPRRDSRRRIAPSPEGSAADPDRPRPPA